jgi:hypothetical protein
MHIYVNHFVAIESARDSVIYFILDFGCPENHLLYQWLFTITGPFEPCCTNMNTVAAYRKVSVVSKLLIVIFENNLVVLNYSYNGNTCGGIVVTRFG